jgi:hypothetical protein
MYPPATDWPLERPVGCYIKARAEARSYADRDRDSGLGIGVGRPCITGYLQRLA